jgi:hypothetical protein
MHRCLSAAVSLLTTIISPFAHAKSAIMPPHEEQEKAIFANLLSGELLPGLPQTYCINTRLYAPQAGDLVKLTIFTPQQKKIEETKIYLKVAKKIKESIADTHLANARLELANIDKYDLKEASHSECENLPYYHLSRALLGYNMAVVQLYFNTSCFNLSGGISFIFSDGVWARTSTVFTATTGGPPVGPPGCSYLPNSFGNDGDTYLKRPAHSEEPEVSPQQLREKQ